MASRLNEEDTSGQNKWADIDDDDEDWAPEAITWGDGTKTTLPHPDEVPEVVSESVPVSLPPVPKESPVPKAVPPAPPVQLSQKPAMPPPSKGLILKASHNSPVPEKPTLVTKPPQHQQPAKSPWATLPPVEKVSPAAPQVDPTQALLAGNREINYGKVMNMGNRDALADEAPRSSWRDTNQRREMFNHQSGRYEPLSDRRGSHTSMRPPGVLQRPQPPSADQPAEPSSAFQTTRSSHEPPLRRRRGSSNVSSGGSGPFVRKWPDGPVTAQDISVLAPRRPSFVGSVEGPLSPINPASQPYQQPRQQGQQGWGSRISPNISNAVPTHDVQQGMNAGPPNHSDGPRLDEIEYQKKLMRERQEMARKRRQEQEAQEEAAKQARIQKKLEAMGPPPEKRSAKKQSSPQTEPIKPIQIQQRRQSESTGEPSVAGSQDRYEAPSSLKTDSPEQQHQYPIHSSGQASRRSSHGQGPDNRRPIIWSGQAPPGERLPTWSAARTQNPPSRNVWGSPDDRALGNGTFNPDLGRPPGAPAQGSAAPAPIGPPTAARGPQQQQPQHQHQQPQAPIGSRQPPRYLASGTDLASQWVSAVADSDRQFVTENLQRRAEREKQLVEQGIPLKDTQPVIKDTWRQVQIPGDGTRRTMASADAAQPSVNLWKDNREGVTKDPTADNLVPSTNAGVIGSGSSGLLNSSAPGSSSFGRASRFFPNRDNRTDSAGHEYGRPGSPTPPPPTMEGHPAYEGDANRPHVSLPKPHPVVKLPPTISKGNAQVDVPAHSFGWAKQQPFKKVLEEQPNWQAKIDSLLNGNKSPPKFAGIDPASKNALEIYAPIDLATVSLPSSAGSLMAQKEAITKPMAEECFEEQEMGSLPLIRLPHQTPDAAWQPVPVQNKPIPRKFLVRPYAIESYQFDTEVVEGSTCMKIQLPGMEEARTVAFSLPTKSARGGHGRGGSRHRGSGRPKRDVSEAQGVSPPSSVTSSRGRGGYRGRGSSWKTQSTTAPVAQTS